MSKAMKVFGMTKEGYEFEHYEVAPLWDNVKERSAWWKPERQRGWRAAHFTS